MLTTIQTLLDAAAQTAGNDQRGRIMSPCSHGRFYRTALNSLLQRIKTYLVRWAKREYKRLRAFKKVRKWWEGLTARQPRLLAHWAWVTDSKYSL